MECYWSYYYRISVDKLWIKLWITILLIIVFSLSGKKWKELFENATMIVALIGRLTFKSHVLDMNGNSYRLKANTQVRA